MRKPGSQEWVSPQRHGEEGCGVTSSRAAAQTPLLDKKYVDGLRIAAPGNQGLVDYVELLD